LAIIYFIKNCKMKILKRIMKSFMNWIKILKINFLVTLGLLVIEVSAQLSVDISRKLGVK